MGNLNLFFCVDHRFCFLILLLISYVHTLYEK